MRSTGRSSLTQPVPEPFFLLDQSLSHDIAAEVFRVTGYHITTIWDEWPDRDFNANSLPDEEIIPHMGDKAGHRALWITCDWDARRKHRDSINRNRISVLWLRGPGGTNPTLEQQTQMLCAAIGKVRSLISESDTPVYLRARLDPDNNYRPFLEQLQGSVLDRPLEWQRVPLI